MLNASSSVAHRWFEELWNQGRIETIDQLSMPDTVGYGQIEHDGQINMEQFRALFTGIRAAFPDIRFDIEHTVTEKDMVVLRWRAKATHNGEFLGTAPTNRRVEFTGMSMMKISDGKIVRGWDNWDQFSLLMQIGAVPSKTFINAPHKAAS